MDLELDKSLEAVGAVLLRGTKACGKSETSKQKSASILQVDRDPQVVQLMAVDPSTLLVGDTQD